MHLITVGTIFLLSLLFTQGSLANPVQGAEAAKSGEAEMVRKTCDCVRRHPSGFPYIEPRTVTCKAAKSGADGVPGCINCYSVCAEKSAN